MRRSLARRRGGKGWRDCERDPRGVENEVGGELGFLRGVDRILAMVVLVYLISRALLRFPLLLGPVSIPLLESFLPPGGVKG